MISEADTKKLRWRSRRGMLELDLLLLPFFDNVFMDLSEEQQQAYMKLLDQNDPDLMSWFARKSKPDDMALAELVEMILDRSRSG